MVGRGMGEGRARMRSSELAVVDSEAEKRREEKRREEEGRSA